MQLIRNFIDGLKKSFDGKTRTRKLKPCPDCGKPSYFHTCLFCSTEKDYLRALKDFKEKQKDV